MWKHVSTRMNALFRMYMLVESIYGFHSLLQPMKLESKLKGFMYVMYYGLNLNRSKVWNTN